MPDWAPKLIKEVMILAWHVIAELFLVRSGHLSIRVQIPVEWKDGIDGFFCLQSLKSIDLYLKYFFYTLNSKAPTSQLASKFSYQKQV